MYKSNDLPVYLKVYKLLLYLYGLVEQFPKSYKFTLGETLLTLAWQTLDSIVEANLLPNNKKAQIIRKALETFEQYSLRIKIAHELKLINHRRYAYSIGIHEETQKMLRGWLTWAKRE